MNAQYSKPSDQSHRIQVQSNIIYAMWMCNKAWAETDAPFEVKTSLVGKGAEIKIRLMNDSGKTLDKKSDKIFANKYRGTVAVPSNVKLGDQLYLEIELPKHNLDTESDRVPAGPIIQARSMQWSRKEAKPGDTVKMQAQFIDLPDKTQAEVTIYEYDPDNNHDPVITIPTEISGDKLEVAWEFTFNRDVGQIPTRNELKPYNRNYRAPEFFFVINIDETKIGVKQESGLLLFKDKVDFVLKDSDGQPIPDTDCVITGPDGKEVKAKSDKDGKVLVKDFPPGSIQVRPEKKKDK
ncbi:MAG: hypothetical protein ABSF80_05970 [Chitinispirillaceae bacterium]|jgi:hypothetical protein